MSFTYGKNRTLRKPGAGDATVVPDSSTAAKKIFKGFKGLIPRFLQRNDSSQAAASSSIRQPLLSRFSPAIIGYLKRRSSTTEGEEEEEEDGNGGGGIFSRLRRSIRGGGGGGGGRGASFHEPQRKILIAEGLPTPPAGRWYLIPPSLAFLHGLATKKEECKKAITEMEGGSSASLTAFSVLMFGFVASMDKMTLNCDHLLYVEFSIFCAVAFELLLGYLAVSKTGDNFWKFNAIKEVVLGLNIQMQQQLHLMEVDDYEDTSNEGFHDMLFSCQLIIQPIGLSKMILFQISSLLLMVITIGFTINNVIINWRKMC